MYMEIFNFSSVCERYDRNCVNLPTVVKNELAQHRLFGVSLTHQADSDSSLISALFVKTDSLLLFDDGIKLLISNIVPIYKQHWGLY